MNDIAGATIAPLVCKDEHDGVEYEAICYPAGTPAGDWTLKNLRVPEDVQKHPAEAERIGRVLAEHGIKRAYAPHVAPASGIIIPRPRLSSVLELPHEVTLFRNAAMPADGVALGRGEAFVMSGGGCPVLVMSGDGMCIAAHASRDSLLDTCHIRTGERNPDRPHKSVINAMVSWAARRETSPLKPRQSKLSGYFSISTDWFRHSPDHPDFGVLNVQRAKYIERNWGPGIVIGPHLCLNIENLSRAQARTAGFTPELVVFREEIGGNSPFGFTQHPDPAMRPVRSLNIVHRIT